MENCYRIPKLQQTNCYARPGACISSTPMAACNSDLLDFPSARHSELPCVCAGRSFIKHFRSAKWALQLRAFPREVVFFDFRRCSRLVWLTEGAGVDSDIACSCTVVNGSLASEEVISVWCLLLWECQDAARPATAFWGEENLSVLYEVNGPNRNCNLSNKDDGTRGCAGPWKCHPLGSERLHGIIQRLPRRPSGKGVTENSRLERPGFRQSRT